MIAKQNQTSALRRGARAVGAAILSSLSVYIVEPQDIKLISDL